MQIDKCWNHFFTRRRSILIVFVFVLMVLIKTTYFFAIKWNSTSAKDTRSVRKSPAFTCPKWIVVTSINKPTEQIKRLSEIPGWKLLVVADKKTLGNWTHPNTIILTTKTQLSLNYEIAKFLPWNAYTRKVIGYLYAIEHGAEFIYDTEDDNAPNEGQNFEKYFDLTEKTRGLIAETNYITLNPYSHFGQPTVWPRGYPLEYIGKISNNTYTACQMMTPLVQQGLVNGDPDVDAIFRLTRKQITSPLNIQFDGAAPPLIFPKSVFAPFNSHNTLFHYKAFWAMILPISVEFRVTDIWRGYWAQPLLWAIGTRLGFYSNHEIQRRNSHLYLRDFGEEDQLYKQAGTLVNFLKDWNCSKSILYDCMIELTILMAEKKFWSLSEVQVMEAWISDLKSIGYRSPILQTRNSTCVDGKLQSFAIFKPVEKMAGRKPQNYRIPLRKYCNLPMSTQKSLQPIEFDSILLVVTFNLPHYDNIWLLDSIYRPHYPNMVYCGEFYDSSTHDRLLASERFASANIEGYSFLRATVKWGYFAYDCALRVIDMNYKVSGYLVLSDDVLLNIWNIRKFSTDQVWSPENCGVHVLGNIPHWKKFKSKFGPTDSAMAQIYNSSANVSIQFRTQREANGYNASTILSANSDILYFPKIKEKMFYKVGSIMRNNKVFLEIALPIIMSGLSATQNTHFLNGKYIWHRNRSKPFKFFEASNSFLHPVKLTKVFSNRKLRVEYCRRYVTKVLEFGETTTDISETTKQVRRSRRG